MAQCENTQLIFEEASNDEKSNDEVFRNSFKLIAANKLLREQVADCDSLLEEIICSLSYGPDNEFVRQAIDIYNNKWYRGR